MWDPQQYEKFAAHRARPFHELVQRMQAHAPRLVVDLGCGTGGLTAQLWQRWPTARVVGVDSSAEMLAEAERHAVPERVQFVLADLRDYRPDAPVDVLVCNAALQWVPEHLELFPTLAGWLAPGGSFGLQVPGNFAEPSHTILRDLRCSERWRERVGDGAERGAAAAEPAAYLRALLDAGLAADVWETTYLQLLSGENPVLDWVRGTALRPVLARLSPAEQEEFCADYGARLRAAYPPGPDGTVLPFRRIFAVGRRPGGAAAPLATRLEHVQAAIPPGGEDAARGFYGGLLGLVEVAKPPVLAARGGCWFRGEGVQLHLGVEAEFRPWRKAHVALVTAAPDGLAARLEAAGRPVRWDDELAPRRRFYTEDPFGNRVEVLAEQA